MGAPRNHRLLAAAAALAIYHAAVVGAGQPPAQRVEITTGGFHVGADQNRFQIIPDATDRDADHSTAQSRLSLPITGDPLGLSSEM
jgi:hypothetical protein